MLNGIIAPTPTELVKMDKLWHQLGLAEFNHVTLFKKIYQISASKETGVEYVNANS